MFTKELELIQQPIIELIKKLLLNGFKNRQGRSLHSVDSLNLVDIEINEDKSSFKEVIYVNTVIAYSRIWVEFHDSITNDNIELSLSKEVILEYNNENKEYKVTNEDDIKLVDRTF